LRIIIFSKKKDSKVFIVNFSLKETEIRNINIIDINLELGEIEDLSSINPIKLLKNKANVIDNINLIEISSFIKLKIRNKKKEVRK
tara:strand:+ start:79 stop:336 length:258 start_codon:yes stop_codon:yes gene_type:complete